MTTKSSAPTLIEVPSHLRPDVRPGSLPFDAICKKGEKALDETIRQNGKLLEELIEELMEAALNAPDRLKRPQIERLMHLANDVRGIASTMGSELTSDIANAIFGICENALTGQRLPKSLVVLLAQSGSRLIGYRRSADNGKLQEKVQVLLADVHARLAEAN